MVIMHPISMYSFNRPPYANIGILNCIPSATMREQGCAKLTLLERRFVTNTTMGMATKNTVIFRLSESSQYADRLDALRESEARAME